VSVVSGREIEREFAVGLRWALVVFLRHKPKRLEGDILLDTDKGTPRVGLRGSLWQVGITYAVDPAEHMVTELGTELVLNEAIVCPAEFRMDAFGVDEVGPDLFKGIDDVAVELDFGRVAFRFHSLYGRHFVVTKSLRDVIPPEVTRSFSEGWLHVVNSRSSTTSGTATSASSPAAANASGHPP